MNSKMICVLNGLCFVPIIGCSIITDSSDLTGTREQDDLESVADAATADRSLDTGKGNSPSDAASDQENEKADTDIDATVEDSGAGRIDSEDKKDQELLSLCQEDDPCHGHGECDPSDGTCSCEDENMTADCSECASGYIDFPDCGDDPCDPDPCNDHGECDPSDGTCTCDNENMMADCSECASGYIDYPDCRDDPCDPDPCNGHGECEPSDGTCTCDNENMMTDCSDCVPAYTGYPHCNDLTDNCTGRLDFSVCSKVTTPVDRSYDICVGGQCVSPGCGDASCNAPEPHFTLADTNQRSCYDTDTAMTSCPFPSQSFYGQDAQYGWDITHVPGDRFTRDTSTPNQPVVTDNVTGLMWQGCALGYSGNSCSTVGNPAAFTWQTCQTGRNFFRSPTTASLIRRSTRGPFLPRQKVASGRRRPAPLIRPTPYMSTSTTAP